MEDFALYHRLGEVVGELKGTTARMDELLEKIDRQETRLAALEYDKAYYAGAVRGMRWLALTSLTIATALGADRVANLIARHV